MSVMERDPVSGQLTTGHDWNGIKELNNPVPRFVIAFIVVTHLYALIAWFLLPTWPLGQTYTRGLLGIEQQTEVEADLARAQAEQAVWMHAMATEDFDAIRADPELMTRALTTAGPLFGQNCQVCHGEAGEGGPGFPRLADDIWVWGGTAPEIAETIRYGINNVHPDSRYAEMPAFGRDGMLSPQEIGTLTDYVLTLGNGVLPDDTSEGAVLFQDNCASCHGDDAHGIEGIGAPDLTDSDWLYGGHPDTIHDTLMNGRQGEMPAWTGRLSEAQIRMLALYVEGLSGDGQ